MRESDLPCKCGPANSKGGAASAGCEACMKRRARRRIGALHQLERNAGAGRQSRLPRLPRLPRCLSSRTTHPLAMSRFQHHWPPNVTGAECTAAAQNTQPQSYRMVVVVSNVGRGIEFLVVISNCGRDLVSSVPGLESFVANLRWGLSQLPQLQSRRSTGREVRLRRSSTIAARRATTLSTASERNERRKQSAPRHICNAQ